MTRLTLIASVGSGEHVLFVGRQTAPDGLTAASQQEAECRVSARETAAEAVDYLARTDAVDCVVSEASLPDVDGVAFLELLRLHRPGLALVALTDDGHQSTRKRALRAGVDALVDRSRLADEPARVAATVDGAISTRRARGALADVGAAQASHLAAADDPTAVVRDDAFVTVNEGFLALAGTERQSDLGTPSDRLDPDQLTGPGFGPVETGGGGIRRSHGRFRPSNGAPVSAEFITAGLSWQGEPATLLIVRPTAHESAESPAAAPHSHTREQVRAEFEQLINGMNDTAWVIGRDEEFRAVNDAAVEHLGYTREELLAMKPHDIDVGLEAGKITDLIENMPEDEFQVFETVHETKDGERIPVEISSSLVRYHGEEVILSIGRDISDRKEREAALRRTRRAVEAAGHAIYITDTDGHIEYVNPAFEEITGYDREEVLGETPSILKSGEMPESYAENLWDTILAGEVWEEELINRRKDGDLYHVHQTISPVRDDDGEVDGFVAIQTDITDRKALDRRQRRFRQALEGSEELFAAIDCDQRLLFSNERYREFHGLEDADLEGRHLQSILGDDAYGDVADEIERVLDGASVQFTTTRTHPERGPRLLSTIYHPIRDDEGEVRGAIASMRDVTEEREESRRLETLIGNLPGIVYRCRLEPGWPMEFVGGRCQEITGYPASKLEADEVLWGEDVVHPDDQARIAAESQAAVEANEPFELTYRIRTADGETRWIWEQGREVSTVTDDGTMLEGFMLDVTEQQRRQSEIRQKSRAMDEAPIGITISDPDREDNPLIYVNRGFERLTGYSPEEAIGENCRFLQGERTDQETVDAIRQAIDAAEPVSAVVRNYRADGTEFWNSLEVAPVRDEDGTVTNFIGFQQDVTERVERQEQLQRIDHVLRHNLRNDMTVIMGMADDIRAAGSPDVAEAAEAIIEQSESLLEKTDTERDIVQVLEDEPRVQAIDVVALLASNLPALRETYPDATVDLTGPETALARGTDKLERALQELVENALQHNDRAEPTVTVSVTVADETVRIDVADDGPGIPEMERNLITGEEEETPLYHGSGLGLWLVALIVRRCGGTLSFSENEPRGSVVHVTLPRADD